MENNSLSYHSKKDYLFVFFYKWTYSDRKDLLQFHFG